MGKNGENGTVIVGQNSNIGPFLDKWSDFGYVSLQRSHYLMKCTWLPSQKQLAYVSMIIWSFYDKRLVRMWGTSKNNMVILGQHNKIGQLCDKWSVFKHKRRQRPRYFVKYTSLPSQNRLTRVSMMIWSHYDRKVERMQRIGENGMVLVKLTKLGFCWQIERFWFFKFAKIWITL